MTDSRRPPSRIDERSRSQAGRTTSAKDPGQLSAWERWELPLLDSAGNEVPAAQGPSAREEDIKPLTAADIEAIRQSAWEEGRTEGFTQGYEDGLRQGRQQGEKDGYDAGQARGEEAGRAAAEKATEQTVRASLERLEQVMAELLQPLERHRDELESALVNLATVVARAVIHRELSLDSSQVAAVVREAVSALPSTADNVRIRVNPKDEAHVREVADRLEAAATVTADPSVLAGGCKVETRHTLVDYTVEKRFQKAVQAMLEQQLTTAGPGETEELDALMGDLSDFHGEVLTDHTASRDESDHER